MLCRECGDVISIRPEARACFCGQSSGRYLDHSLVEQTAGTLSIALHNHDLRAAVESFDQAPNGWHPLMVFRAYLNPLSETDVRYAAAGSDAPGAAAASSKARPVLALAHHQGDRAELRPLLRIADDSEAEIDRYIDRGVMFVVREADELVGHLLLTETDETGVLELKSIALLPRLQGMGGGRQLVDAAIEYCKASGAQRLLVATAAAGVGQLRFYQRVGFRMLRIERDAFGPQSGYADDILVDGVPLRDRVWLAMELTP
jgi:GNAT superfamily N-acetyltransferase